MTGIEDQNVVKRVTVTLDDETHASLQKWAEAEARSVPNLLAYLALRAIKDRQSATPTEKKGDDRHE